MYKSKNWWKSIILKPWTIKIIKVKVFRKNSLKITGVTASKKDLEIDVKMS